MREIGALSSPGLSCSSALSPEHVVVDGGPCGHRSQLKGKGRYFGGTGTSRGSFSLREKVRMRETRGTQSFFLPLTLALSRRAYHYPHLDHLR